MAKDFEVGDLVWSKMRNCRNWPSQIVDPPADAKSRKGYHYVFFLGSNNYAWMKDETITHHAEHMIPEASKKKPALLQRAIDELIELNKAGPVDQNIESTDDELFEENEKRKSLNEDKSKDIEKSPKVIRKRISFGKSVKGGLENGKSPKKRRIDEGGSLKPMKLNSIDIPSYSDRLVHLDSIEDILLSQKSDSHIDSKGSKILEYVPATTRRIGFLGLGSIGLGIAKNLLGSGHNVTVWDQTSGENLDLLEYNLDLARGSETVAEVVKASDIIFCCISDSDGGMDEWKAKKVVYGNTGVLKGLKESVQADSGGNIYKGYVEMTSICPETSVEISEAIEVQGGRYLEAAVVGGTKSLAEDGNLLILTSGNRQLFEDCRTCFHATTNLIYYLGSDVGQGSKYRLIISSLMGTVSVAMAQALTVVKRLKVDESDFLNIINLKGFSCPQVTRTAKNIIKDGLYNTAVKNYQKDIDLTLLMSDLNSQPMPVTAAANEVYKKAKPEEEEENLDIAAILNHEKYSLM